MHFAVLDLGPLVQYLHVDHSMDVLTTCCLRTFHDTGEYRVEELLSIKHLCDNGQYAACSMV